MCLLKKINFIPIIYLIFSISLIINYNNYDGSKLLFIIFHIICLISSIRLTEKNISSVEFYLIIFLILSFWLKYSYLIYIKDFSIIEGNYDANKSTLDGATKLIIVSFCACIFSSYIRKILIDKYVSFKFIYLKYKFKNFYKKYKLFLIFLVIIYLFSIYIINFNFKIHAKGITNNEVASLVKYFFAWNYTYGLALIVSTLLFIDYKIFKNQKLKFFVLVEPILTSVTSLSRAGILFFFVYLRGLFQIKFLKVFKNNNIFNIFKILILSLIVLYLSIYLTSHLRNKNYNFVKGKVSINSQYELFKELAILRWVGIDGVLAVSQKKNKNFELFYESIKESKSKNFYDSFYINNFFQKAKIDTIEEEIYHNNHKENVFWIVTPGIVAFLSYSGSKIFLFFSLSTIIILLIFLERFFLIFSGYNYILTNIIGFSLSFRLIHFGYLPSNSIKFLLSYLITLFLLYILFKLVWDTKR